MMCVRDLTEQMAALQKRAARDRQYRKEYREMLSLAVVAGALRLSLGSAAPPRAPARGGYHRIG